MSAAGPLTATYRLQFHCDFTFADATAIIGYLHRLGISHVYASPYLKARSGSPHGYDIVDHNAINPEIGSSEDFAAFVDTLHANGMGQILDIVPNHMGVGGCDNTWWLDVLEHGEASAYARYFDIDWHPIKTALHGKLLLPMLGDHYGTVLESGQLQLDFELDKGSFTLRYYEHCLPIDPRTWPGILDLKPAELERSLADAPEAVEVYQALIARCQALPARAEPEPEQQMLRRRESAECKTELATLCRRFPAVEEHIRRCVAQLNGTPGEPASFDDLHRLIEVQAYRPAYWQVAGDEINYRRFFDINDLAGLCQDDDQVFRATHELLRSWMEQGKLEGLRVDHLDGLSDPADYCRKLRALADSSSGATQLILAEKILASHEYLPEDWPVSGTTGYETAYLLNGLFVRPDTERRLTQVYTRFCGGHRDFDRTLYRCKQRILRSTLASELTVLANQLVRVAEAERHTRDFTYHGIRDALGEIVAAFPVYRTYVTEQDGVSDQDRRYIQWAVAKAKQRSQASDIQVYDFIHDLLVLAATDRMSESLYRDTLRFITRFQQYTAPVMAKGMEDTAFYVYNRLTSLTDVGFDPRHFGISPSAFHHENANRLTQWPRSMVSTSTHDSKRGEDVRARIDVLSELPEQWRKHLGRWSRLNRRKKHLVDGLAAPSRNDEYLLYQTLLGVWPLQMPDAEGMDELRQRVEDYMIKAIREAKEHSSWINPHPEYEAAVSHFIGTLFRRPEHNAFLTDFLVLHRRVAWLGLFNSLSQTLLRLTVPGCPDTYQGNELWAFNLVDPDNRRPVDYQHRQALLNTLVEADTDPAGRTQLAGALLHNLADQGRAKMYVTRQALQLRREAPALFGEGEYLPLAAAGPLAEHVVAFARHHGERTVIVAAARWFAGLVDDERPLPIGAAVWADTRLLLPESISGSFQDRLSGQTLQTEGEAGSPGLGADALFRHLPLALLVSE